MKKNLFLFTLLLMSAFTAFAQRFPKPMTETYKGPKKANTYYTMQCYSADKQVGYSAIRDIVYNPQEGLKLTILKPTTQLKSGRAVILACGYDPKRTDVLNRDNPVIYAQGVELAKRGVIVFLIDYNPYNNYDKFQAIPSYETAIRWVKANAGAYGYDANNVVAAGASFGGALALYAGSKQKVQKIIVEAGFVSQGDDWILDGLSNVTATHATNDPAIHAADCTQYNNCGGSVLIDKLKAKNANGNFLYVPINASTHFPELVSEASYRPFTDALTEAVCKY